MNKWKIALICLLRKAISNQIATRGKKRKIKHEKRTY